ncbi:MAG: sigma-70 family RNA polymerase sigma factor [Chloroflexi bacterium]|nr:sigma-70 family RNA polymerase sigma factor [Chloroflexota bacterium]
MAESPAFWDRVKAFDEKALGQVFDEHQPRIYRYIQARVGDSPLAEDLTGEVFIRMLEAIRAHKTWTHSFAGWLYGIAHNLIIDDARRRKMENRILRDQGRDTQEQGDAVLRQVSARDEVQRALAQLTEDQRNVLLLRFAEGLSHQEVAHILGKSIGAVKTMQYRAMLSMARQLHPAEPEASEPTMIVGGAAGGQRPGRGVKKGR